MLDLRESKTYKCEKFYSPFCRLWSCQEWMFVFFYKKWRNGLHHLIIFLEPLLSRNLSWWHSRFAEWLTKASKRKSFLKRGSTHDSEIHWKGIILVFDKKVLNGDRKSTFFFWWARFSDFSYLPTLFVEKCTVLNPPASLKIQCISCIIHHKWVIRGWDYIFFLLFLSFFLFLNFSLFESADDNDRMCVAWSEHYVSGHDRL